MFFTFVSWRTTFMLSQIMSHTKSVMGTHQNSVWQLNNIETDVMLAKFETYMSKYDKPYYALYQNVNRNKRTGSFEKKKPVGSTESDDDNLVSVEKIEFLEKRFQAFQQNVHRVSHHNTQYQLGLETFTLALNDLADLTDEEYREGKLGYRQRRRSGISDVMTPKTLHTVPSFEFNTSGIALADLPDNFDWREHDAVTDVKNQKMCGSCWAFSAVASMECVYARTMGKLESFSEQELVDCVNGGRDTCTTGGEMQDGFKEIIANHKGKIDPETVYKYTGSSKGICHAIDESAEGHFTSYVNVTSGDEDALKAAVALHSVNSIAIDASSFLFQLYHHGVFSWPFCKNSADGLDHGVAVVGYGTWGKAKIPYWLVKNSWSTTWGMHGYIMMSRNKNNQCGVATDASFPVMTKN